MPKTKLRSALSKSRSKESNSFLSWSSATSLTRQPSRIELRLLSKTWKTERICQNTSFLTVQLRAIPTSELNRLREQKAMISKSLFRLISPFRQRSSLPARNKKGKRLRRRKSLLPLKRRKKRNRKSKKKGTKLLLSITNRPKKKRIRVCLRMKLALRRKRQGRKRKERTKAILRLGKKRKEAKTTMKVKRKNKGD